MEREIVRVGDNCEACRTNTDPRKVPVHPNCNCEVITQNVVPGVDPETWQPIERWVRENGKLRFIQGNLGQPVLAEAVQATGDPLMDLTLEALAFEPSTVLVLDLKDSRWSDIERWLMQMEPLLAAGEHVVGIVSDAQDAQELAENIALGAEVLSELLSKRIFLSLIKVGLG